VTGGSLRLPQLRALWAGRPFWHGDEDLLLLMEDRVTLIPDGIVESIRPQHLGHLGSDDL